MPIRSLAIDITISLEARHQTMVGFGAAISWYGTWLYGGNSANDAALNQLMFQDCGLDVLRLKNWYYPGEGTTADAVAVAQAYSAAKAANTNIQVLCSSWSPPATLKSNGIRTDGSTLATNGLGSFKYTEFAQYWSLQGQTCTIDIDWKDAR